MRYLSNTYGTTSGTLSTNSQSCVITIRESNLPSELKEEMRLFAQRNTLPDCGRVPPNCFKAHLIKTAKKMRITKEKIDFLKRLIKGKIGYKGYYLDKGKLKRV
tara:strand:- start:266 stop:577 length:312 start_codon:yes stop_codon:yes gene_type:complete